MIPEVGIHLDIILQNYVQASKMLGSIRGDDEDEWECGCGGPPPPEFLLPPPPKPPDFPISQTSWAHEGNCDAPWTCPSLLGAREDLLTPAPATSLAVVIVCSATLLVLIVVAAIIVYRIRVGRGGSSKGCTELNGAIIYDDLSPAPTILSSRARPGYKPAPTTDHDDLVLDTHHLYSPEPRSSSPSEHLYQSISSGSETCSCSTNEAKSSDGRALLPKQTRRLLHPNPASMSRLQHCSLASSAMHHLSAPSVPRDTVDSEDESLAPCLGLGDYSDEDTPLGSPAHPHLCVGVPLVPLKTASTDNYESVYYVESRGGQRSRPATPQERGLPPLPSRSDRFRIYFSLGDRGTQRHSSGGQESRKLAPVASQHEMEPLYENISRT